MTPDAAEPEPRAPDQQLRGSALLALGRLVSLILALGTQVLIVRTLSQEDYGVFAYALGITAALELLLGLGQNRTLSRSLAIARERGDAGRLFGALALVSGTIVVTTVLLFTVVVLARDPLSANVLGGSAGLATLSILLLLAPLEALDHVFVSLFAVFSKPTAIFFRKYVLTPLLRLVVVVGVIFLDGSIVQLATGYVAAQGLGLVLYLFLARRLFIDEGLLVRGRRRRIVLPFREALGFSLPLLTTELVFLSFHSGNVVLLGALSGATAVASYYAVFSAARLNRLLAASFEVLYLPTAARLFARDDPDGIRDAYWRSGAMLTVTSFPVFLMTVPFAEQTTVTLLGERYAGSSPVLALLGTAFYLDACFGFNVMTLQVFGRVRMLLLTNGIAALLNLGLALALIPRLGATGVGISVLVARTTQNLLNQSALGRELGSALVDRERRPVYLLTALMIGLVFGVDALVTLSFPAAVAVAGVVGLAVLLGSSRTLRLGEDFPELKRLPVIGQFFR